MKKKDKRGYRKNGLDFSNVEFGSRAERLFVKTKVVDLANKIAILRREKGLSQEKLAELANVSTSTIKFIEQNQRAPSLPLLLKLMYILDRKADLWS